MDESSNPVSFLLELANLSSTKRAGWGKRGIEDAESVSDHSYSMTMMNLMLQGIGDPAKRARMALIHDMVETLVGDITPSDGVPKNLKQKKENLAMEYYVIEARFANAKFAEQLKDDWREFEENETYDAHLVHDTDRYDCAIRLLWYEKRQGGKWRQDKMFQGEIDRIVTREIKIWAQKLTEEREAFWASRNSDDLIILIMGPPGSGKTTQSSRLAKKFDMHHISVGEILRIETEGQDAAYGDLIKKHMAKDEISGPIPVPAGMTMKLLRQDMQASGKEKFIIDGFPRTVLQLLGFMENISGKCHIILLHGDEEILIQRLAERAESSNRVDDDSLDKRVDRVKGFKNQNSPVEEYLQSNQGFTMVDCNGTEDQVFKILESHVQKILSEVGTQ